MNKFNIPIHVDYRLDSARLILPVRLYIRDDEGLSIYKVIRTIRRDRERIEGSVVTTFTCEVEDEDMKQLCDIRFKHETNEWMLLRI